MLEGIELTDSMLEGIAGGFELSDYHKSVIRHFVKMAKAKDWDLERFIEYLNTESMYACQADCLEAAITYSREVW